MKKGVTVFLCAFLLVIVFICIKVNTLNETISENEANLVGNVSDNYSICETDNVSENKMTVLENTDNEVAEIQKINDEEIPENMDFSISDEMVSVLGHTPDIFDPDKEYDNWFDLYSSLVYDSGWYDNHNDEYEKDLYTIAYIDQNNIPELIKVNEDNYIIYTWDKVLKEIILPKDTFAIGYSKKTGKLFCICRDIYGNRYLTGYIYDKGDIQEEFNIEGELLVEGDSRLYAIQAIKFDSTSYRIVENFIDLDNTDYLYKISYGKGWYSGAEILSVLQTGHDSSFTHRYELIYADVSWDEAQEICNKKGGYLAVITSQEEVDRITELFNIDSEKNVDDVEICYIGCRGTYEMDNRRWILTNGNTSVISGGEIYVDELTDSEWYSGLEVKCENEEADCGFCIYRNYFDSFKMYMGPQNIIESNPELSGKVGFICEYDE